MPATLLSLWTATIFSSLSRSAESCSIRNEKTSLHSFAAFESVRKFHKKTSSNSRPFDSRIVIARQPSKNAGSLSLACWFLTKST